jgi:hypothetical protein
MRREMLSRFRISGIGISILENGYETFASEIRIENVTDETNRRLP